ncbi:hypothetical protein GQ43DRAFT_474627 [Delitschia confertaspora ATCC 74209]|uniref:Uncharacterized protein n=1 Tax=Delitschia confertaspora ATCC 74209 TaxID=1513339 RepID=A0A9P4JFS8_9PLEO|nr:hypothetical protein GQ43DRAFT_474627 [Delitschia confertaspora ATCC 74209]
MCKQQVQFFRACSHFEIYASFQCEDKDSTEHVVESQTIAGEPAGPCKACELISKREDEELIRQTGTTHFYSNQGGGHVHTERTTESDSGQAAGVYEQHSQITRPIKDLLSETAASDEPGSRLLYVRSYKSLSGASDNDSCSSMTACVFGIPYDTHEEAEAEVETQAETQAETLVEAPVVSPEQINDAKAEFPIHGMQRYGSDGGFQGRYWTYNRFYPPDYFQPPPPQSYTQSYYPSYYPQHNRQYPSHYLPYLPYNPIAAYVRPPPLGPQQYYGMHPPQPPTPATPLVPTPAHTPRPTTPTGPRNPGRVPRQHVRTRKAKLQPHAAPFTPKRAFAAAAKGEGSESKEESDGK